MPLAPAIFTFYSYKGGVGRSLSALNVAYCLAARGRHVLLVDMDLEAAGLSGLLLKQGELPEPPPHRDVVDLIQWARDVAVLDAAHAGDPAWVAQHAPILLPFLSRIPDEKIAALVPQGGLLGSLHVLGADQDRDYAQRLTALGLTSLDADQLMTVSRLLRQVFQQFRLELPVPRYIDLSEREAVPFDYVLVDSRTGLTEVGGLCVGPLADRIVLLCGLNDQNIDGTRRALEILGITGGEIPSQPWDAFLPPPAEKVPLMGCKPTLLVASPVPSGEITLRKQRVAEMEKSLGGQVAVQLPYDPQLALYETIFVRDYPIEPLARRYLDLAALLERAVSDHASQLFKPSMEMADPIQRLANLHRLLRLAKDEPRIGIPVLRALLDQPPTIAWQEDDYKVLDKILGLLTQDGMQDTWVGWFRRAVMLASWAEQTPVPLLATERTQAALRYVDQAINSAGVPTNKLGMMHGVRGRILIDGGDWQEGAQSLTIALQAEQRDDERAALLARRGLAYRELRQAAEAIQDFTEALNTNAMKPKEQAKVYLGRGLSQGELLKTQEAVLDFNKVLVINEADPADKMAARFGMALCYNSLQEFDRALSEYDVVISNQFTKPDLRIKSLTNRGELYLRLAKPTEAVMDLTAAYHQAGPGSELAWAARSNRALAYTRLEQWQPALDDARAVLQAPSVSPAAQAHALHAAVVAHVGLGELEAAHRSYAELVSLQGAPTQLGPSALVALGWGAYLQKDYHQSAAWSRQAAAQAADDRVRCVALANLGLALLHLGDVAAAQAAYAALPTGERHVVEIEAALQDLRAALAVQPLLPGAQQIYDTLATRLAAPEPA